MNRRKLYIILLMFLAAGLFFQFLTQPMIRGFQATKIKLEEKRVYLVEKKEIIKRIDELREERKSWKDRAERLDLALPADPEIISVLFQFQNFAMDSGLVMKSFSHQESAEPAFPGAMKVFVSAPLTGSYSSLKAFLKKLEKNLRIIDVQGIEFSPEAAGAEGKEKAEQLLNINFSAQLYYFPQEIISPK